MGWGGEGGRRVEAVARTPIIGKGRKESGREKGKERTKREKEVERKGR